MSAFKPFLASDIIITPFEVNKSFTFLGGDALTGSNVTIDRFLGKNITDSLFNPNSDLTTGNINTQYQRLVYNSIKELYYSNHLSSSYIDNINTSSLIPGRDEEGNRLTGTPQSDGRYFNYPQTTLTYEKYFPTASNETIGVISIPSGLFGNFIKPNSFRFIAESGSIYDDGEGNLIFSGSGNICGNIFYGHGLAIITSDSNPGQDVYGTAVYGSSVYGISDTTIINNIVSSPNVTCSFSSSLTIYESQYKCTIRENEFNASLNPSLISGSDGTIYDFATGSAFAPFITTIGLYDENRNLLAVGKLGKPLPSSPTTDTNILINIDR